jgi:uncharacterized protein (DUF427 family)
MRAIWKETVVAESDETVLLEGNHYFPANALKPEFFTFSNHQSTCFWKGKATYQSLIVDGELNSDAVWTYEDPKPEAESIRGYFAFWKGVQVKP